MSYILDALRKSEEQRRLASTPDLGTEHRPAGSMRRGNARLFALLGAGLLLNALVVGAWLFWPRDQDPASAAPDADRGTAIDGTAAAPTDAGPSGAEVPDPTRSTESPTESPTEKSTEKSTGSLDNGRGQLATSTPAPAAEPPVPIRALSPAFRQRIGPLSFSTHIYADEPRFREVAINGRTHREGARVGALLLIEITEDGVILELEGRRFSVSVLQDWDY